MSLYEINWGISPLMIFAKPVMSLEDHRQAILNCLEMEAYHTMETILPDDERVRKELVDAINASGKEVIYNFPLDFQFPETSPCSLSPEPLEKAIALAKRHLEYASKLDNCKIVAFTSGPDCDVTDRDTAKNNFKTYCRFLSESGRAQGVSFALEPVERNKFKKLLLGPTSETCAFIAELQAEGCDNISSLIDVSHLIFLNETFEEAFNASNAVGIADIHVANMIETETSVFYGHRHPGLGEEGGPVNYDYLVNMFMTLIRGGYIHPDRRPHLSLETIPYRGISSETSAKFSIELMQACLDDAAEKLSNN